MLISVATATFYFLPFSEAVEIIAQSGLKNVELDLYWERKNPAMAQHLKDIPVREVARSIAQAGLHVSSIHDGGGVLEDPHGPRGHINPALDAYLDQLGYAPDCLVFHTPHVEGTPAPDWWERISVKIAQELDAYRRYGTTITIENMPEFEGYSVAMTTPEALNAYVRANGLGVTLDTTHCALGGVEISAAARILRETVRTIHLSDFRPGAPHAFIGDGELDLSGFFRVINLPSLKAVTLECGLAARGQVEREMSQAERVERLKLAYARVEKLLRLGHETL